MKHILACMFAILALSSGFAADNLSASSVTTANLKPWLESAGYECRIDSDGDLICENSKGAKFVVFVLSEKKLVQFVRSWSKPSSLSIKLLKEKANEWNNEKIFVRFAVQKDGDIGAEYFLVFNSGLNKTNFLESVDWFMAVSNPWATEISSLLDD